VATKGDPDAPVNRGLNCVKGYFNGKIIYGKDRLTQPLMRMTDGKFDKKGKFEPVSWEQAFDEMEAPVPQAPKEKGPTGVHFGSGQYTIQEGYAAAKLMKAGFRSNNIDPNARHCMAFRRGRLLQTFGIDEPAGQLRRHRAHRHRRPVGRQHGRDAPHPVVAHHRPRSATSALVVNLTTYGNMSSDIADLEIIFKPNGDLAIQNYIAREIVARNAVNWDFVKKHCVFATGPYDIGYGFCPTPRSSPPPKWTSQAKELAITLDKCTRPSPSAAQEGERSSRRTRADPGRSTGRSASRTSRKAWSPTRWSSSPSWPRATRTSRWTASRPS
jgi:nitrate reductase (cytochrome)